MENYQNLSTENLPNEVWLDIPGYYGKYKASNLGRIKSVSSNMIMKQYTNKGYLMISLRNNGCKKHLVHRIIAECFIPKVSGKTFINHINEDKKDNRVENLEWCTPSENNNHGSRNNRISQTQLNRSDCSVRVLQYSIDGTLIKEWPSLCELSRNGYDRVAISRVCRGVKHYNTSGGYIWRFA